MWQMRLQVLIQLKNDNVTQCFEEAFKHLKSKVCAAFMDLHALSLEQETSNTWNIFFLHKAYTTPNSF